ncbi:MAG: hypothetical protein ACI9C1_003837 [Candidatus Aldehydirespiratoraceae bacterium]|jgi:hypothetical protein
MSHTSSSGPSDVISIDIDEATVLAYALLSAAEGLRRDRLAVSELLSRAETLTVRPVGDPLVRLAAAQVHFDGLVDDLWGRLVPLRELRTALLDLDGLSREICGWTGSPADVGHQARMSERWQLLLAVVGGDISHALRVSLAMQDGLSAAEAIAAVHNEVSAEMILGQRVAAIRAEFAVDEHDARAMIARIDLRLALLVELGFTIDESVAALGLVENFDLNFDELIERAAAMEKLLIESAGDLLLAQGLGLELGEFDALVGLEQHLAVFDTARGGRVDHRFALADLTYVLANATRFTAGQVEAARALYSRPELFNRLDTANENSEILGGEAFGNHNPGDGVIADVDLHAFMLKTQLHAVLGEYADQIDIANDSSGIVDGFRSPADFRAFLADNPELPDNVILAAETMIERGWFDENFWQRHKDEIAAGAALLAAAGFVVLTAGGASIFLVGAIGAAAAGTTTAVINLASDDELTDELLANTVGGFIIGVGVSGVVTGTMNLQGATGLARVGPIATAVAGGSDIVATGGLDLLLLENYEDDVHAAATAVGAVATPIDVMHSVSVIEESISAARVLDGSIEMADEVRAAWDTYLYAFGRAATDLDGVASGDSPAGRISSPAQLGD